MPRATSSYVNQYLNKMASASPTGSVEAVTGLPIYTGLQVGGYQEFSDAEALAYSYTTTGTLYGGTYMWVQLDPAITSTTPLSVGIPLYWLESNSGYVVTTTVSNNAPDYAGVVIDGNMQGGNPYAWIQINGKATALFAASVTNGGSLAYGDIIGLKQTTGPYTATFDDIGALGSTSATCPNAVLGYALAAPTVSLASLVRITRAISRF